MSTSMTPVLTSNDGTVMISAVNPTNIAITTTSTPMTPKMTVTPVTLDHQSTVSNASTTTMSITPTSFPPTLSLFSTSSTPVSTTSGITTMTNTGISSINRESNHLTSSLSSNNLTNSSLPLNQQQPTINPVVILTKQRLQELVTEIDPKEQLDEEVEDTLLNIADDFIENLVTSACQLAKHRGSKTVDVKDVQLILEKNYNMLIPGFGSLPLFHQMRSCYKKSPASEAHKQRMALIKKTLKKF